MTENKEKKVVLMLAKKFFAKHISASKNTNFQKHLESGRKIHTIRSNYDMWKHDIEKINNGGFVLSIRQWEDKPYRSKQEEIKCLKKVGYERITMEYNPETKNIKAIINGKQFIDVKKIAENDGLKWEDFIDWFFGQGMNKTLFQGIIIHFTDFRYHSLK